MLFTGNLGNFRFNSSFFIRKLNVDHRTHPKQGIIKANHKNENREHSKRFNKN
jgi:hypothetical protein